MSTLGITVLSQDSRIYRQDIEDRKAGRGWGVAKTSGKRLGVEAASRW